MKDFGWRIGRIRGRMMRCGNSGVPSDFLEGNGTDFAVGEVEAGAEEVGSKVAALAEDAAQDAGDGALWLIIWW